MLATVVAAGTGLAAPAEAAQLRRSHPPQTRWC